MVWSVTQNSHILFSVIPNSFCTTIILFFPSRLYQWTHSVISCVYCYHHPQGHPYQMYKPKLYIPDLLASVLIPFPLSRPPRFTPSLIYNGVSWSLHFSGALLSSVPHKKIFFLQVQTLGKYDYLTQARQTGNYCALLSSLPSFHSQHILVGLCYSPPSSIAPGHPVISPASIMAPLAHITPLVTPR